MSVINVERIIRKSGGNALSVGAKSTPRLMLTEQLRAEDDQLIRTMKMQGGFILAVFALVCICC